MRQFPLPLIAAGVVVALLCLAGIVFGVAYTGRGGITGQPRPTVTIGQPARDQTLEFTVRSVHCGQTSLGSEPAAPTPAGQFCLVAISVRNVGNGQETYADQNQKALSPQGTPYFDDTMAGVMVRPDNPLSEPLEPGGHLDATLVYDIPKGERIDRLQLRDSAFTGGVEVRI
jgi:hypothetical protein